MAYYLAKDEDSTDFERQRFEKDDGVTEPVPFHFVRDYVASKVEHDMSNEFLIVIDEGDTVQRPLLSSAHTPVPRAKGVYYKNIERKMFLKKKRANVSSLLLKFC